MIQSPGSDPGQAIARRASAAGWVLLLIVFASPLSAQESPSVLTSLQAVPEGRLLRLNFQATGPMNSLAVSRQGPPNARDLVLELAGVTSALSVPPTDTSGRLPDIPYEVSAFKKAGRPVLRVVLKRLGDSLVRLDHYGGQLTMVLIPLEKGRTKSTAAYRIGSDDVLAISIFGHDDLTKTMKVSPDGLINYPLIGKVMATSRTVDEVSAEIQERLATDFLVNPHVTVSVWEYLSQWVNVIGAVTKPGRYYITGPITVIDAISQAGGVSPEAGEEIVVTRRPHESDPSSAGHVLRFSTAAVLNQSGERGSTNLRPGDVVNVLSSDLIQVSGAVNRPGPYPAGRNMTLSRAIALAGGLSDDADPSVVDIQRRVGSAQRSRTVDFSEVQSGKIDDMSLRPGDEVIVRKK